MRPKGSSSNSEVNGLHKEGQVEDAVSIDMTFDTHPGYMSHPQRDVSFVLIRVHFPACTSPRDEVLQS